MVGGDDDDVGGRAGGNDEEEGDEGRNSYHRWIEGEQLGDLPKRGDQSRTSAASKASGWRSKPPPHFDSLERGNLS